MALTMERGWNGARQLSICCRRRSAAMAVVTLAAMLVPGRAIGQQDPTTTKAATIFDSWSKRTAAIHTAKIEWRQESTGPKPPSAKNPLSAPAKQSLHPKAPLRVLQTVHQDVTLCLDGDLFSFVVKTEGVKGLGTPPYYKAVFDGKLVQTYAAIDSDDPKLPAGTASIKSASRTDETDGPDVRPMILAFRGLRPPLAHTKSSEYRVTAVSGQIGDVSCILIERIGDENPHVQYWLDPKRDYIVLREVETFNNSKSDCRTDISYRHHETYGWIPQSWRAVQLDHFGEFLASVATEVTDVSINQTIPPSVFQLEMPLRTQVHDQSSGRRVVRTLGDDPGLPKRSGRLFWLLVANAIFVLGLVAFIVVRYYVRRRPRRP
jgi:hypothetical protein